MNSHLTRQMRSKNIYFKNNTTNYNLTQYILIHVTNYNVKIGRWEDINIIKYNS